MSDEKKRERLNQVAPDFIESAQEVFGTMVFMPLTVGGTADQAQGAPRGYISSTISLTGEDFCGNLSLIFSLPLATSVFRSMMSLEPDATANQQEINDVVGELANMVAGGAKSRLQTKGVCFRIGLPTVVVGENHYIEPPKHVETMDIPLRTEQGVFYLELSA